MDKRITIISRQETRKVKGGFETFIGSHQLKNATDKAIQKKLTELNERKRNLYQVSHDFNLKTQKGKIAYAIACIEHTAKRNADIIFELRAVGFKLLRKLNETEEE